MAGVTRVEAKESAAELEQLLKAQTNPNAKSVSKCPYGKRHNEDKLA